MFLKHLTLCMVVGLSLGAVAQGGQILEGTHGRGRAHSADGRRVEFRFECVKAKRDDKIHIAGRLNVAQPPINGKPAIEVIMERPGKLMVDGNKAVFEGPAILVIKKPGDVKRIKGGAVVRVADNKKPDQTGSTRDFLSVHYKAAEGDLMWGFEGAVADGDIVVRKNQ